MSTADFNTVSRARLESGIAVLDDICRFAIIVDCQRTAFINRCFYCLTVSRNCLYSAVVNRCLIRHTLDDLFTAGKHRASRSGFCFDDLPSARIDLCFGGSGV